VRRRLEYINRGHPLLPSLISQPHTSHLHLTTSSRNIHTHLNSLLGRLKAQPDVLVPPHDTLLVLLGEQALASEKHCILLLEGALRLKCTVSANPNTSQSLSNKPRLSRMDERPPREHQTPRTSRGIGRPTEARFTLMDHNIVTTQHITPLKGRHSGSNPPMAPDRQWRSTGGRQRPSRSADHG
jgi:hypothetical protein